MPERDAEALLEGLDPEQRSVATALDGPVAVIAGAGTGKTRAITHRIAYGVAIGRYRPTAVLAVTFTTRAAGELRHRLQQLGASGVQARTFHSAALRQAQYFWPRARGGELPAVLDNRMSVVAEAAHRLRVSVDTPRLRDLVGEISWAKVSNTAPEDYPRVAAAAGRKLASLDAETVGRIFAGYENVKRDRGRIDFEDILLCTADLIAEHDEVREAVRRTYRHLVVDEYQDVSPLQQALLDLWRGERGELCVVGDPAQTIHSFAGAQASYLTNFARRHRDATVIRLVRDYRSTPQVVSAANRLMAGAGGGPNGMGAVTLQAQRPTGPDPVYVESADEAADAAGIADWLVGLAADGVAYREMAVLFRINAQSPTLEQALADRGVPYLVRGGERFYERGEVRQALIALRAQLRSADDGAQVSGLERVRAVFGALGWTEEPPEGAGQVRERWESLAALMSVAQEMTERAAPLFSLDGALDDSSEAEVEAEAEAEAGPGAGTRARTHGLTGPPDLADIVAELDRRAEAQQVPAAEGVTVSTLHSAKGLEWDAVALMGVHEGSLPFVLATKPEQVAEERRLLYVGVTRAREHLRISWSRTRTGGSTSRKPSRFLDPVLPEPLKARLQSGGAKPAVRKGSVLSAHCRSCGLPLSDGAERKIGRHHDCPSTYDEQTMVRLKQWRREESAEQQLPAYCVFTDATLVAIAEARPRSAAELIKVQGLGPAKAAKYGEHVLKIIAGAPSESPEKSVAKKSENRFAPVGDARLV